MTKKAENFLDFIPKQNALLKWKENEKGHVEIRICNRGIFNRIAQIAGRRPKYSDIELDDLGSFVWKQTDGVKNVYEIAGRVRENFGEEAEPLYERLSQFIKILHDNGFAIYVNRQKKK